jgi:hypothetical protein
VAVTEWTQEEAMAELDPHFDEIDAICRGGLARYQEYPADIRIEHDRRTAANCIYSHMATLADDLLTEKPDVVFLNIQGLKVWVLGERTAIRFKRMDEDGRWSNHTSQQQTDFDRQLALPGIPYPPLNLVAGYFPNATGTDVERVQIARPAGRAVDWCAAIVPTSDRIIGQPRWADITRQARF